MMKKKRSLSLCVCVVDPPPASTAPVGGTRGLLVPIDGGGPPARERDSGGEKANLLPVGVATSAPHDGAARLASPFPSLSRPRAWTDHLSRRDPHIPFQIRPHPTFIFFTRLAVLQIDKSMLFQSRAAYLMSASGFSKNFCTRLRKFSRHLSFSSLSPL